MMNKKMKKYIMLAVVLVLGLVLYGTAVVAVPENEYILIKQFNKVIRVEDEPGLTMKIPFLQTTQSIPKEKMFYDLAISDVNTKDKKMMVADCFALWRIEDPVLYVSSLGANRETAESRIDTIVYNSLKNVISSMNQDEVISGRDGKLAEAIRLSVGDSLIQYGIELLAVETKQLDLPDENKSAVFDRMISERENISASYTAQGQEENTKIKSQTDMEIRVLLAEAGAEAEKTKAEGEAQYMNILSEAYNDGEKADFYNYVRSLDALKESLKGSNTTVILDKDSAIVRALYGIQ